MSLSDLNLWRHIDQLADSTAIFCQDGKNQFVGRDGPALALKKVLEPVLRAFHGKNVNL